MLQNAVERKVPIMIQFLSNDYDDVSAEVLEFAKEYIHVSIIWNLLLFLCNIKLDIPLFFNLKIVSLLYTNDVNTFVKKGLVSLQ